MLKNEEKHNEIKEIVKNYLGGELSDLDDLVSRTKLIHELSQYFLSAVKNYSTEIKVIAGECDEVKKIIEEHLKNILGK